MALLAFLYILILSGLAAAVDPVFTLRSAFNHGFGSNQTLLQHDIPKSMHTFENLQIKTRPIKIERLVDRRPSIVEPLLATARQSRKPWTQPWMVEDILAPNVSDRDTIINFALMAANAYTLVPGTNDWEDLDKQFGFNTSLELDSERLC